MSLSVVFLSILVRSLVVYLSCAHKQGAPSVYTLPRRDPPPPPPPPPLVEGLESYFLAAGGLSCEDACLEEHSTCDMPAITAAAAGMHW